MTKRPPRTGLPRRALRGARVPGSSRNPLAAWRWVCPMRADGGASDTAAMAMDEIIGDYAAFFAQQKARLAALSISITGYPLSHLAFRTETLDAYLVIRERIEAFCVANVENVWNGRPISKLLLREPIHVEPGVPVSLIELIPPPHQNVYQMGLEHVGVVVTGDFEAFASAHAGVFTGRQYQSEICQPWYIAFEDHTNVKFYDLSLHDVVMAEGRPFYGFHHAID